MGPWKCFEPYSNKFWTTIVYSFYVVKESLTELINNVYEIVLLSLKYLPPIFFRGYFVSILLNTRNT